MLSDHWLSRYRLLENFSKVERERVNSGDYNSSFALRAVELKKVYYVPYAPAFYNTVPMEPMHSLDIDFSLRKYLGLVVQNKRLC